MASPQIPLPNSPARHLHHPVERLFRCQSQAFLNLDPGLKVAERDIELLHRVERHIGADVAVAVAVGAGRTDEFLIRQRKLPLVEDVRLFLEALDREMPLPDSYAHILDTNYSYWLNIMGKPEWGAKYQLWIAAWTTAARPAVPAPWATWTLWQHTSSAGGQAHGVQSDRLDLNRFNGTAEAFERWAAVPAAAPTPSLEETLRATATPLVRYVNPTFALPAAIIARGQQVNSPEAQASHGGIAYTLELGLDARSGAETIYYARTGDWQNVRSVPMKPPQPAGPAAEALDLLPYLMGDGRLYEMKVVRPDGVHSQQVQTQRVGDGRFYHVKNRQWEELWADGQFIYRGTDTSHSEDTYYTLRDEPGGYGSRWCPRTMNCLLYTSDAADERSSVDLGGRRIIKKKNSVQVGVPYCSPHHRQVSADSWQSAKMT